jgi:hypothetical protein
VIIETIDPKVGEQILIAVGPGAPARSDKVGGNIDAYLNRQLQTVLSGELDLGVPVVGAPASRSEAVELEEQLLEAFEARVDPRRHGQSDPP